MMLCAGEYKVPRRPPKDLAVLPFDKAFPKRDDINPTASSKRFRCVRLIAGDAFSVRRPQLH
ncbi:MAG: hypothetical protein RL151_1290 [Bacteroidota bacterium]